MELNYVSRYTKHYFQVKIVKFMMVHVYNYISTMNIYPNVWAHNA